jgi:hypothetical protein
MHIYGMSSLNVHIRKVLDFINAHINKHFHICAYTKVGQFCICAYMEVTYKECGFYKCEYMEALP